MEYNLVSRDENLNGENGSSIKSFEIQVDNKDNKI